jgi:hypothetical protein
VSLTLVRNSSAVLLTLVKHAKTEKVSLTGVNDAGENFLTSVNYTSNVCFAGFVDTGKALK